MVILLTNGIDCRLRLLLTFFKFIPSGNLAQLCVGVCARMVVRFFEFFNTVYTVIAQNISGCRRKPTFIVAWRRHKSVKDSKKNILYTAT